VLIVYILSENGVFVNPLKSIDFTYFPDSKSISSCIDSSIFD